MSNFGNEGYGFSLKALLEDPNLQNPPPLNQGNGCDLKKGGKLGSGPVVNYNSAFLGANLWEKSSNNQNGGDFDLEYMDLDEFLSENGIPIDLEDTADTQQAVSLLETALTQSPPPQSPNPLRIPGSPSTPPHNNLLAGQQEADICKPQSDGGVYLPESPICQQPISPISLSPVHTPSPPPREPSAIEKCLLDDNFGIKLPEITPTPAPSKRSTNKHSQILSDGDEDTDTRDFSCVTIPGQENFDPSNHKFSVDELKPQPIIKKSRKVFVDDSVKDDKYWQRRKKNNIAAKRSRDARRVKENQIAMRAAFLERENDELREEMQVMLRKNERLIERLSKYEKV